MKPEITAEIARELLTYHKDTGDLAWKHRHRKWFKSDRDYAIWNTRYAGTIAGSYQFCKNKKVYRSLMIFSRRYRAHRICYLIIMGVFPKKTDHIDGNGTNNKWINLREVTPLENNRNRRLQSNNKTGVCGVGWDKNNKKWQSHIRVEHKMIGLGRYNDFFEAICARKSSEVKYNFHINHGVIRPL